MTPTRHAHPTRRDFFRQGVILTASAALGSAVCATAGAPRATQPGISPVEDLLQEHGVLNRILVIYDEAIQRLDTGVELPLEPIRSAAKIVREYVEDYHEKLEQDYLFPRFTNANQMPDLVKVLLEQHVGGRNLTDEILHLTTAKSLATADDRRNLANFLRRFARMYHAHESREDTILFPAFRTLVSPHEYAALREEFDKRERELFGGESFPRMAARISAIETQLGISDLAHYTDGV